ncbi:MAG: hypothetical protein IT436_04855 [Phycisphaerales bacterium]|nr:hypothetical protein [Phycisphaerales bacterium]
MIPATVPGCIHTDLMDAGLIPDPAVGMNEREVQWVSWTDWRYELVFDAAPGLFGHHEIDLVFECLDTVARLELNGQEIGEAQSEFIPHRFGVLGHLRPGENRLAVTFTSPLRYIHEQAKKHGPLPVNGDWDPFCYIRKCASNFQWDWGPKVATCGISSGVQLIARPLRESPLVSEGNAATTRAHPSLDPLSFQLRAGSKSSFCLGANWIPEGLWPRDRTYLRVRRRLEQARAAGMNMIRIWGGGRYEPDWFYDTCDELGLMVWQDFMFACACYPEHEEFRTLVEAEARYQVARLSRHPSVVLWCGGNECEWAYDSWGFKEKLAETGQGNRGWGQYYYRELLPRIVEELSPGTPYIPNSPFSPTPGRHPNDVSEGDRHTWDLIGDEFRSHLPRFCSEFGIQSPSCRQTLAEAGLLVGPVAPGTVVPATLAARQRGPGGMQRWYDEPLARLFPAATGFDEWLEQAHEMQARHLYTAIVWLRANPRVCSGALIWQLNDAWPGLSWSLIDSAGREKPAYEAVKRAFAPRLIDVFPIEGRDHLVIINDTGESWVGRHEVGGRSVPFDVGPRSAARIPLV